MKRAVRRPQRGQSTARSGLETSTYRALLAIATVDFGFYPVAGRTRRPRFRPSIYFMVVAERARVPLRIAALFFAAFALGSCGGIGGISPIFPQPVSPNGQDIYNLYELISIPAVIVFVGVEAALLWVVLRYRRSKQPPGYVPPQIHGHNGLEIAWTIAPLIIVLAIAAYSFVVLSQDFQPISNQQMLVKITGHQFGWDYTYENGVVVHQEGTLAGDV